MKYFLIIFDNHLHLRRDGRFLDAVNDFKKSGGTHFVLCQYPMPDLVIKKRDYLDCYEETLKMAHEIKRNIDIGVFITVGPYPIDYIKLNKKFDRKKSMEIMKKGMDQAAYFCQEYEECIGIGEIGRPHFKVSKQIHDDSNEILLYGMKLAKEIDVPVILHTESTTPRNCKEFAEMGKKVGLSSNKIVKHFSPPLIYKDENHGLMPSVLASNKNITEAIQKGTRFMMETDYIDDPKRPGAVLGPKTVPKRTKSLIEKNLLSLEQANIIHKKNPESTYSICLDG